jgi:hypothetical protein
MSRSHSCALLAAAFVLTACGDAAPPPSGPAADTRPQAAHEAAEGRLRERMRAAGEVQLRGVQVFAQAIPNTFAVCGRANATGTANEPLLPWVAQVSFETGAAQVTSFVLGSTSPEATRVFAELVDRCFEGGGPAHNRMAARPLPPLPAPGASIVPASSAAPAEDLVLASAVSGQGPQRSVVTSARSGANIRTAPRGGEVVRTVPRASTLQVFGEAPGGWYQVGQGGTVWGWVHASVLDGAAR